MLDFFKRRRQINKEKADIKQSQLEMVRMYNSSFLDLLNDIRRQQHDMKNHINAIYSQHYTCKTYDELVKIQRKYCDYIIAVNKFGGLLSIDIPLIGGFLYSKFQSIENNGVTVDCDVKIHSGLEGIPAYEIIAALGIIIDNGFEAVQGLDDSLKRMKCCIFESNAEVRFTIKNISEYINQEDIIDLFKPGYSSKGQNRGMGLSNVKEKALKYGFEILVKNEEIDDNNWICFTLIFKKRS